MIRLESALDRQLTRLAQRARRPRPVGYAEDVAVAHRFVAPGAYYVDIVITPADVVKGTGAATATGTAGGTITAGQPVYADASDGGKIKAADANVSDATATVVGIALHGATANQPITYQTSGNITLSAVLTLAKVYVLSATAGGIAPVADLATGWRTSILGVALSTTSMMLTITNSNATNA